MFRFCVKKDSALDKILWFISTSRSCIVIGACTVFFSCFHDDPYEVAVIGDIAAGLPSFRFPPFLLPVDMTLESDNLKDELANETAIYNSTSLEYYVPLPHHHHHQLWEYLKADSTPLLVIPLLALMEHITAAKALAGTKPVDASQEMIAIGLTNMCGAFFNSMPVTGSFSRSMVNAASGAETPLGGLFTGSLVLLALQFLTPYFYYIPNASLAAVSDTFHDDHINWTIS